MERATILTSPSTSLAVFCFPPEPNIPEDQNMKKYQQYIHREKLYLQSPGGIVGSIFSLSKR